MNITLSDEQNKQLYNVVKLEGEITEIISTKSSIISFGIPNKKLLHNIIEVIFLEIFSSKKYPIGLSLETNKELLKSVFNDDQDYLDNNDIVLVIIGETYDFKQIKYIWNGKNKVPWKIGEAIITDEVLIFSKTTEQMLTNIIKNIKYTTPINLNDLK